MTNGDILSSLAVFPMPPGFNPGGFDCGEDDLTDFLCDGTADREGGAGYSKTYLVMSEGGLVGYFSVLADSIRLRTKERPEGIPYATAPAVKLGRMGVHLPFRRRGVGIWILDYVVGMARALSDDLGVRYVTLDALNREKLVAWYTEYGFVRNQGETDRRKAVLKFFKRFKADSEFETVSMRYDILLKGEVEG